MFYLDAHSAVQTNPLVPHNETYHATHCSAFDAVLLHLLSIDPRRVFNASDASFCVVSMEKFALEVMRACAGKTVAVIDAVDMDLPETGQSGHARLWRSTCPRRVLQIVGSAAVLTKRRSACAQLAVPWVSHLYEPQRAGGERPLLASASWNSKDHGFATLYGFTQWRVDLRHGCHRHRRVCVWKYQSLSGSRAFDALGLYRASRFCPMPPGDNIVRQAIVDAVTLGCVPVFFPPHAAASVAKVLERPGGVSPLQRHERPSSCGRHVRDAHATRCRDGARAPRRGQRGRSASHLHVARPLSECVGPHALGRGGLRPPPPSERLAFRE